jgi:hypothetical protein
MVRADFRAKHLSDRLYSENDPKGKCLLFHMNRFCTELMPFYTRSSQGAPSKRLQKSEPFTFSARTGYGLENAMECAERLADEHVPVITV